MLRGLRVDSQWLEGRLRDVEHTSAASTAQRYDLELRNLREQLRHEKQRLEAANTSERERARRAEEALKHATKHAASVTPGLAAPQQVCG